MSGGAYGTRTVRYVENRERVALTDSVKYVSTGKVLLAFSSSLAIRPRQYAAFALLASCIILHQL